MKKTHYDALGLKRDATPEEIKEAYRRLRGGLHPDRDGGDTEAMAALNAAYTVLSDPIQRTAYDAKLPNIERDAAEALETLLTKHLEIDGDPIAAANEEITTTIDRAIAARQAAMEAGKRLRKHLTKLRFKGRGENVAARIIKRKIAARLEDIEQFKLMESIFLRARALLNGYEYEQPAPEPEPVVPADVEEPSRHLLSFLPWGAFR